MEDDKFKSSLLGRIDSEIYNEILKKHQEDEFVVWNKLLSMLILKFRKLPNGEMNIDTRETYEELSKIFDLKFKK